MVRICSALSLRGGGALSGGTAAMSWRVYGMLRPVQHRVRLAFLDDDAVLHHGDAVGDLGDHAEIMRDEEHGCALAPLQVADQREDLRLRGDVERGGRLVGDQYAWIERERHRDHGALALAARQFMRIDRRGGLRIGDVDLFQKRLHPHGDLGLRQIRVDAEHLADLVADGAQRVERRHRLLEDHRDAGAAHLAHVGFIDLRQIAPLEQDAAAIDRDAAGQEPHHGIRHHRFAGAGLADHADDLVRRQARASRLSSACGRSAPGGSRTLTSSSERIALIGS